jgi:NADH-ubiquinone oxidoreductase chain 2
MSSILSLVIGSVLGLTQFRIKRLFAYSTISHVGFILLALSINTVESTQAYIFYLLQYSISNLNAFLLLISIGFSLYLYTYVDKKEKEEIIDKNNSPIQLISQIKGFFFINSFLAISLSVTIFSFVGIPPLIGFFAKQMVLSAALDSGYTFVSLVAVITSVIGAGYYLNLIKQVFFYKPDMQLTNPVEHHSSNENIYEPDMQFINLVEPYNYREMNYFYNVGANFFYNFFYNIKMDTYTYYPLYLELEKEEKEVTFPANNVMLSSSLSSSISILTLLILLFIFMPTQWFNIVNILTIILFKG